MSLLSPEFRNPDPIDLCYPDCYRPFLHCVRFVFGFGNRTMISGDMESPSSRELAVIWAQHQNVFGTAENLIDEE